MNASVFQTLYFMTDSAAAGISVISPVYPVLTQLRKRLLP